MVYTYIYICIYTRYVIQVDVTCSGHPPYNICIYICINIYIYTYIYIYLYVYIYIYMFRKADEQRGIDVQSSGRCYICMYSIHAIPPYICVYVNIYIYIYIYTYIYMYLGYIFSYIYGFPLRVQVP